MTDSDDVSIPCNPGVKLLIELAHNKQKDSESSILGLSHWLLALLERHQPMVEEMIPGINFTNLKKELTDRIAMGDVGKEIPQQYLLELGYDLAKGRGKTITGEKDLAMAILRANGYTLANAPADLIAGKIEAISVEEFRSKPSASPQTYTPVQKKPTPVINEYLEDLTQLALDGKLGNVIGRDEEIDRVIETLCRRTKRNPALIGPAGVGKTAIVEGLAQRVIQGQVPAPLQGVRIVSLQPTLLMAGASMAGELEKRLKSVVSEASQEGVILFIDEMHTIMGVGGQGRGELVNILKPPLARGNLACIAATTDDEYRRYIEPDSALERRFAVIHVQELSPDRTYQVMRLIRDDLQKLRNVTVSDFVLKKVVKFSGDYMRNRNFPDKSIDLLEQCVAYAVAQGKPELTMAEVEKVTQRMVGMPISLRTNLSGLCEKVETNGLLSPQELELLKNRLAVTLYGLDARQQRPNAMVLMLGPSPSVFANDLATCIASCLYGSDDRIISIDFSQFAHPEDVNRLLGSPAGYVGYDDPTLLEEIVQMPWAVLICDNINLCHPLVLSVFTQGLEDGFITTARGRRIFFSDLVILLTAQTVNKEISKIGFLQKEVHNLDLQKMAESVVGSQLSQLVDVIFYRDLETHDGEHNVKFDLILADLTNRFEEHGIHLEWDDSVKKYLLEQMDHWENERDWERFIDEKITSSLIPLIQLPEDQIDQQQNVRVSYNDSGISIAH